jgi:hypothetical protein
VLLVPFLILSLLAASGAQSPDDTNQNRTPNPTSQHASSPDNAGAESTDTCAHSNRRSLFTRGSKINCGKLTIDMTEQRVRVPRAIPVSNGSHVEIRVKHVITEKCPINFTAAALTTSNPLASILSILGGGKPSVSGGQTKSLTEEVALISCLDNLDPSLAPSDAEAHGLEQRFQNLRDTLEQEAATLDAVQNSTVLDDVNNFATCTPKSVCSADNFDTTKQALQTKLDSLIKQAGAVRDTRDLDEIQALSQIVKTRTARGVTGEGGWLVNARKFLNCAKQEAVTNANAAQRLGATLESLRSELAKLSRVVDDVYVLPLYHNEKVTGNVVCSDQTSKSESASAPPDRGDPSKPSPQGATKPPVPIEIDYQNPLFLSGSAGIVTSLLGQHIVGIKTKNTPNGPNAFTTYFAVTNQSPAQFIPFGFAHLFLYGTKTTFVSLSGGVGINPYNSTTQIEYFVGPSFSTHSVYLSIGAHVGRYQDIGGGFSIGSPVPAGWTTNTPVPTTLRYTARLAFGISYKLP